MQSRWSLPSHKLERVATAVKKPARRSRARVKRWYSFSAMASGGGRRQKINPQSPTDDLERRDDDGEDIPDFRHHHRDAPNRRLGIGSVAMMMAKIYRIFVRCTI